MHLTNFHFYNQKNYLYSKPVKGLQGYGVGYRFAFNGQEKDDDVSGAGNTMTAEFWEYDSRLGRRWNVDPISYPWQSTYCVFNNCPISFADPDGLVGVNPPGAPENPCPGDKYKHKDKQGTEWEYEYNEKEGWQSNGGTQTKPLKDVIVKPPLTNKGDVVTASNLPPSPSSSNTPSSADVVSTVAIGVSPAGIGLDLYTLSTGRDYGTQEKVSMGWRIAGVVPFVSEIKGIKKLINLSKLSRLALTFGKLHKHHVLPKAFKPWFNSRGITNIDDYTVLISAESHLKGVHGNGLGNLQGNWNERWLLFINNNLEATPSEIFHEAENILREFGLEHLPYVPYR